MSTTATPARSTTKNGAKSRMITLHLSADALANFPSDSPSTKRQSIPSIKRDDQSPSPPQPDAGDKSSDSNSTPVPSAADGSTDPNSLAPPKGDSKKKRGPSGVSSRKRAPPTIDPDAPPKERGRPGPKKKPRLPDGSIDRTHEKRLSGAVVAAAHKLGPKANTGAINAGLRALDRSGKPCRKWEKKGLVLKSFTGAAWNMSTWKAPQRDSSFAGDVKSDSAASSEVNNKPNESSVVPSDRSNSGMDPTDKSPMNGLESSPAPPVVAA